MCNLSVYVCKVIFKKELVFLYLYPGKTRFISDFKRGGGIVDRTRNSTVGRGDAPRKKVLERVTLTQCPCR